MVAYHTNSANFEIKTFQFFSLEHTFVICSSFNSVITKGKKEFLKHLCLIQLQESLALYKE